MEINIGVRKQKVYRRTERRAEPAFIEIRRVNNNEVTCPYCRNVFFGPDRSTALQHLDNHIMRKHFDRVRETWYRVMETLSISPSPSPSPSSPPSAYVTSNMCKHCLHHVNYHYTDDRDGDTYCTACANTKCRKLADFLESDDREIRVKIA